MNELESRLLAYGERFRSSQDLPVVDLSRLGSHRARSRWPIALAILGCAAATTVAVLAVGRSGSPRTLHVVNGPKSTTTTQAPPPPTTAVPWTNRHAAVAPPTAVAKVPRAGGPCRPSELAIGPDRGQGGAGSAYQAVSFRYLGASSCVLPSQAGLTALDITTGHRVRVPVVAMYNTSLPLEIFAGQNASLNFVSPFSCPPGGPGAPVRYQSIVALLSAGPVPLPGVVLTSCGSSTGAVDGFTYDRPLSPATGSLDTLTAIIHAPGGARAGQPYAYTVELTNPTSTDVSLAPCPSYTEGLDAVQITYELNCDIVDRLPAGGSVLFTMNINVPATVHGATKILWGIVGGQAIAVAELSVN